MMPPQYCYFKHQYCAHNGTCSVGNKVVRENCVEKMRARYIKIDARKIIGHSK